jgi:hypothetical protein
MKVHVADDRGMVERVEQDRRGDVVRQVADQTDRCAFRQCGEIHHQHVGFDDAKHAVLRRFGVQARNQVAVDLDRGERPDAIEQRPGQRALPGSDLDDAFAGLRVDRRAGCVR